MQARYQHLLDTLRCPKCENQTIGSSSAPIAQDMVHRVETWLEEGASDDEIRQRLVDRFGEYVLYTPRMTWRTGLLWGGPFLLVMAAMSMLMLQIRRNHLRQREPQLSDDERQRLSRLLSQHQSPSDQERPTP